MWRIVKCLLLISIVIDSVACVDDKCAACGAVAEELELQLSKEKPRNHLDMRHRLDSKGQREGKVIDYRASELRVVELLDGLCENMQKYTLLKTHSEREEWVKVDDWDSLNSNKQEARAHAKYISTYCGRLLEETEDELAELIKKGAVGAGGVKKVLCEDLSYHCSMKRYLRTLVCPWHSGKKKFKKIHSVLREVALCQCTNLLMLDPRRQSLDFF